MRFRIALIVACAVPVAPSAAQFTSMSRSDAVQAAVDRGARLGVAGADTALARAQLISARALPNPVFATSYSKAVPKYHFILDIPIDFPHLRQLRTRAAQLGLDAAQLRYQFTRAMVALDADTTYTRALAARDRLALSHRNALDADSLLHMVERRRDAGDAAQMDVELARVNAGQQTNMFIGDSLTLVSTILDLQAVLGFTSERLEIRPSDSLTAPPLPVVPGRTLSEAAASVSVDAAAVSARFQRRSIWTSLSIAAGFEAGDPDFPGMLPTFGVGIGLPLFDRNRGPIAVADAEQARAKAELTLAQVQARNDIAHATREREIAVARVARDQQLIVSANLVASMSLTAYREGAATLAQVLEAQRTARDVLGQYIDDLANAWVATAELRVLAMAPSPPPTR